ncbi:MAG: hypothetical protein V7L03_12990 [Nostoc sp.]
MMSTTVTPKRSRTTCLRHAPRTWKQATRSVSKTCAGYAYAPVING